MLIRLCWKTVESGRLWNGFKESLGIRRFGQDPRFTMKRALFSKRSMNALGVFWETEKVHFRVFR
jgi:hypothetical protein